MHHETRVSEHRLMNLQVRGVGTDTPQRQRCRALLRQTHWFSGLVETSIHVRPARCRCRCPPRYGGSVNSQSPGTGGRQSAERPTLPRSPSTPALRSKPCCTTSAPRRPGSARCCYPAVRELDQASFMALSRRPGYRPGEVGEQALSTGRPAVPVDRHPAEPVAQGVLRQVLSELLVLGDPTTRTTCS